MQPLKYYPKFHRFAQLEKLCPNHAKRATKLLVDILSEKIMHQLLIIDHFELLQWSYGKHIEAMWS